MRAGGGGECVGGSYGSGQLAVGVEAVAHLLHSEEFSTHGLLGSLEINFGEGAEEQEVDAGMESGEPGVVAVLIREGVEEVGQLSEK